MQLQLFTYYYNGSVALWRTSKRIPPIQSFYSTELQIEGNPGWSPLAFNSLITSALNLFQPIEPSELDSLLKWGFYHFSYLGVKITFPAVSSSKHRTFNFYFHQISLFPFLKSWIWFWCIMAEEISSFEYFSGIECRYLEYNQKRHDISVNYFSYVSWKGVKFHIDNKDKTTTSTL